MDSLFSIFKIYRTLLNFHSLHIYSLYKKKRKHYIIFNNLRTFEDEHFKLTGDLDWHVPYKLDAFHNFSCTITSRFTSSCMGTH